MTTTSQPPTDDSRFNRLYAEGFSLDDGDGASRHFERDRDLLLSDALGSGTRKAALLITLGIDGADCHRVQLDYQAGRYDDGPFDAVSEAIEALEVIRNQLGVMVSAPDADEGQRNAYELGVEAEREGLVKPRVAD